MDRNMHHNRHQSINPGIKKDIKDALNDGVNPYLRQAVNHAFDQEPKRDAMEALRETIRRDIKHDRNIHFNDAAKPLVKHDMSSIVNPPHEVRQEPKPISIQNVNHDKSHIIKEVRKDVKHTMGNYPHNEAKPVVKHEMSSIVKKERKEVNPTIHHTNNIPKPIAKHEVSPGSNHVVSNNEKQDPKHTLSQGVKQDALDVLKNKINHHTEPHLSNAAKPLVKHDTNQGTEHIVNHNVKQDLFLRKIDYDRKKLDIVRKEVSKVIVGQAVAIETLLRAILANGHVLLEGVPGIAKTLMVRSIAETMECKFGRIQFTPDLLPLELIGLSAYSEAKGFYTVKGPIFNNFVLADEINRAPAKVQSALLEAMQEKQATIGNKTFQMPLPFFTFATQNPIESMGTNRLPEAQLDRFLFKMKVDYPRLDEEQKILKQNTSTQEFTSYKIKKILKPADIIDLQNDVKKVYLDNKLEQYIVRITDATRRPYKYNLGLSKYVEMGASPRASVSLYIASKAEAVLRGIPFVTPHHIRKVAVDVLRHRILINYEGKSENITTEDVISEILKKVPIP